jgi:sigma-B regulation protein RsbU (phosphoserine phosphatase)
MQIRWKLFASLAVPALILTVPVCWVFVYAPDTDSVSTFRAAYLPWALLGLGVALLMSFLGGIFSSTITRSVGQLGDAITRVGAGDFRVRVAETHRTDELGDVFRAFNEMSSELELRVEELVRSTAAKEAVDGELRAARRIQASLLPATFPAFPERAEFELYAVNAPATHVGGDFFDFFFRSEHELVLVMADVSGKGVPAALLMAVSRTIVHSLAVQGLEPQAILSEANRRLLADNVGSMYVTLFVAIYDTRDGNIRYANGAHLAPLRVTSKGVVETIAAPTGTLVGILEDCEYGQSTCRLEPGELLVLYTDGVTEARSVTGKFFGDARLRRVLTGYADAPPHFLCELIVREVNAFQGGERSDDLTLLMLRRAA